ncbi:membrane protein insertase YidC, partial [Streptomyces sp. WAC06614]|uniref:YidC/Oxa1 family membrane protein insertase n=1 Tax=Streptomyces sp. WAC06614 TaxID=2487416 RepID=UPI000F79BD27
MSVYGVFAAVVSWLADPLALVFTASATAAAIVLVTGLVRGALHPLNRAVFRGERARAALAPRLAELRRRHPGRANAGDRRKAVRELYAQSGTSPMAGCLPMLLQIPVFFVMHQVFSAEQLDGRTNTLLREALFGAPLGAYWRDALAEGGPLGPQGLVFLGLFAVMALVARWTVLRARHAAATGFGPVLPPEDEPGAALMRRIVPLMPLMAFGTLVMAAFVPLAVGLYLLTNAAWTTAERSRLRRSWSRAEAAARRRTLDGPGRAGRAGRRRARARAEARTRPRTGARTGTGTRARARARTAAAGTDTGQQQGRHRRRHGGGGRHRR